ncbi:TorF family putative porin [Pseudomonas seleniipraecipitans]|uniref:TorF family putative porin n=1 Tax=Phytopseudomonas seleniipraecipitans TaxID=640205 RepID=A0ABY5JC55_9GAMM|nr:TorF family putative porin [Pseudomonas seleniipraecipitans]UUD65628.1 TorF family putative porin [Pseudomonas seleniipraecipitans]
MRFPSAVLLGVALLSIHAQAAILERELGDYALNLGTTPTRSMAQGLVKPQSGGAFHGGLDLSHPSGWYIGQWSPSLGITPGSNMELNSYVGFRQHFADTLGYELGTIRYSHPGFTHLDSQDVYAGLTYDARRFGLSLSNDPSRINSTLLADFGRIDTLGMAVSVRYGNHLLDTPTMAGGRQISSFNDWSLSLSRPWKGIDFDFSYSDSSLSGDSCSAYSGHNTECEGWFSIKASRSLF